MTKTKIRKYYNVLKVVLILLVVMVLSLSAYLYFYTPQDEGTVDNGSLTEDLGPGMEKYYQKTTMVFTDESGNNVSTADYAGKPIAILFWASWCSDCHNMIMGDIDNIRMSVQEAGGELLLVVREGVRGENVSSAKEYLKENGIKSTTLFDKNAEVYDSLGINFVPTVVYLNSDGVLMSSQNGEFTQGTVVQQLNYAENGGTQVTEDFLLQSIATDGYEIPSNFSVSSTEVKTLSDEYLSESAGIMMLYFAKKGDKELFDKFYSVFRPYIGDDIIPWRIMAGKPAVSNATLDDLRFVEALKIAEDNFGGYEEDIDKIQTGLMESSVKDGTLRDFSSKGETANTITLCYVDLNTLEFLSGDFEGWREVNREASQALRNGYISDSFPLYNVRYSYDTQEYIDSSYMQMNEAMVTVYHLARAGSLPAETESFLTNWLKSSPIYAAYDSSGNVVSGYSYESTATYAILVMTGLELQNDDMVRSALWRLEKRRVIDETALNGGYVEKESENYIFDTLMSLLAWQALEEKGFL